MTIVLSAPVSERGHLFRAGLFDAGKPLPPLGKPHQKVDVPGTFFHKVTDSSRRAYPSLKQMIGQMLMLGFSGTRPTDKGVQAAKRLLDEGKIGGLIFMGHNLVNRQQIADLITYFKSGHKGLMPFLALDQEGGAVQRLRDVHGFHDVPNARTLAQTLTPQKAQEIYGAMAKELSAVGFNVNFGPVVDLDLAPQNPIIALKGRSYGESASKVHAFARAFVKAHHNHHILTSLKHYPGHGSSWTDSHEQFVDLSKSWQPSELQPFKSLVHQGLADMVMVGHLYHPDFSDGDKLPASLSRKAIERLRQEIGFQGIVITDDMGMGAIKKYFSFDDAFLKALLAGNDILLLVDDKLATRRKIDYIHQLVISAIRKRAVSIARIRASYERIIEAKGLLKTKAASNL